MQITDPQYVEFLSSFDSEELLGAMMFGEADSGIWANGARQGDLNQIASSGSFSDKARFHALLALQFCDTNQAIPLPASLRADILCRTRLGNFLSYDEFWGRLWAGGSLGILGNMVVECGDSAILPLTQLLGNETECTIYHGSEESTEMALRRYRVKDFAAYYIARIKGYELLWHQDLGQRDTAIAEMRSTLGI